MRIIDLHCYPNTEPWIKSQGPYVEALAKYWNRAWTWKNEAEVIEEFKQAGVEALLVAFDIESVTGAPPCTNEYVAQMRDRHPGVIRQAWGAVDPLKGELAIEEAKKAIHELQAFRLSLPSDHGPFLGRRPALLSAVGDHQCIESSGHDRRRHDRHGRGHARRLGRGDPPRASAAIDQLAADFPDLNIVAAHPGWPWTEEMIAVALHKGNVSWEMSGWAPKYFPDAIKRDIKGRLKDKIMFGSDYPSMPYERHV